MIVKNVAPSLSKSWRQKMTYIRLIRSYTRFLTYAIAHSFYAGIGQTIVISFFIPYFQKDFGMGSASFGLFYSLATWTAALLLPVVGRQIDRMNLRRYSALVGLTLISACFLLAASFWLPLLFLGLMLIRLSGQSLMGHISATTMARYFGKLRGKALGLSSIGHPLGEAAFPLLATQLIVLVGWRWSYVWIGGLIAATFYPLTLSLVQKNDPFLLPSGRNKEDITAQDAEYTRKDVLRSAFFYCVLPLAILPPFLATGFFFSNANVAAEKGWNLAWLATCVVGFSGFRILGSFITGPVIDRFGARHFYPFHLIPMAAGLAVLSVFSHPTAGLVYFSLFGLSIGFEMTLKSALWAEVYGTRHLGAIRSMVLTIMIFSTGISPILFGWVFQNGRGLPLLAPGSILLIAAASILSFFAPLPKKTPVAT